MAAAAAGVVFLTFRGTEEFPELAEFEFKPGTTKEDILAEYYRYQQRPVPPGVRLGVRPTPDAPDSARRQVTQDSAAAISQYLASRFPGAEALLEPLLPRPAAVACAPAPEPAPPPAKRPRLSRPQDDGAPSDAAARGGRAAETFSLPQRAEAPLPADDDAGPSAPPAQHTAQQLPAGASAHASGSKRAAPGAAGASGPQAAQPDAAAPSKATLTLQRTGQSFHSWRDLSRVLREGDVVIITGVLEGPLTVTCARVTLTGRSDAEHFIILAPKRATVTLVLAADEVVIRFANVHATAQVSAVSHPPTVQVQRGRSRCRLEHCDVIGAGERLVKKGATPELDKVYGNDGIELGDDTVDTRITAVNIRKVTGSSILIRIRATAVLDRVLMTDACGSGVWMHASGACRFVYCAVLRPMEEGFYVDTLAPVVLMRCRAVDCGGNAAVFDFPEAELHRLGATAFHAAAALLASNPHSAKELVCTGSGLNGVSVRGGVAVDLTAATLTGNRHTGVHVTSAVLPGATAAITLTGADVSGNGVGDASGASGGIVLEKNELGVSRIGVMVPQGPPFRGVRLSNNRGGDFKEV